MDFEEILELARGGEVKRALVGIYRHHKGVLFLVGFLLIFMVMFFVGAGNDKPLVAEGRVPLEQDEPVSMDGVQESIDPRAVWTNRVEDRVKQSADIFEQKLLEESKRTTGVISKLQSQIEQMRSELEQQKSANVSRELEDNVRLASNFESVEEHLVVAPQKSLGSFSRKYRGAKKNVAEYIPAGSFARAVLETGIIVGTGSDTQSNPEPIKIRLTDSSIFSKGLRTEQVKDAILIGDCSGNLSSERARCRLQTLSLENNRGEIIEKKVEGWIIGDDGIPGVKGVVIDKSSDLLRFAMLNGLLSGMSNFFQGQATAGAFPLSPITGQQNALSSMSTLKAGAAGGAGDAFSKLADFGMERFNSMTPQIGIASGREVDVVFRHGIDLRLSLEEEEASPGLQRAASGNLTHASADNSLSSYQNNGALNKRGNSSSHSRSSNVNNGSNVSNNSAYESMGRSSFDDAISNMNNDLAVGSF